MDENGQIEIDFDEQFQSQGQIPFQTCSDTKFIMTDFHSTEFEYLCCFHYLPFYITLFTSILAFGFSIWLLTTKLLKRCRK